MTSNSSSNQIALLMAIASVQQGDVQQARIVLDIPENFTDQQIEEGLFNLEKGRGLFLNQRHVEALPYFQAASPVVKASKDEAGKKIFQILIKFTEGLSYLFKGNAHKATELLNVSSDDIDKMSFYIPEFKIAAFSFKAASLIALGRSHLNSADINSAEKVFGEARDVHDELLKCLDPSQSEHLLGYAEVYGTRVELAFLFICLKDIPTLDLSNWKKRLNLSKTDIEMLIKYNNNCPQGQIKELLNLLPKIFTVFETLQNAMELAINSRRSFTKNELKELINIDTNIFEINHELQKSGDRGRGFISQLDLLRRLQKNVIQIAKISTKKDFGRFNGIISFCSFVTLVFVFKMAAGPANNINFFYYFSAFILSLITGFGYGALKFQPLLKLLAETKSKKTN